MTEYVNELMLPCVCTRSYQELCGVQERMHHASQPAIEIASSVVTGEISTGRTDVDTLFPDGKMFPVRSQGTCGTISWERPKAPFPIGSHTIEESRRPFVDRILPKANFGYSRFTVPFPLQNVSEGKGFVGELEISVTYTTMRPPYRSGLLFFFVQ